ncbi:SH3 domain-containing protein [Aureibaculum sp. 2210JD6-5]|uniref:SH3 domain-containing protein n=1 Tax=Aureibaculum sp. 2210JD6-5 TaxID=3103957 RepID=UPI002AAEEBE0|nr:SH3 domain-containing protein [Aureibaculum sp. 2210JD6-5]MDY7393767.1 SH3 domain-containing protein [Aureibaculum sp. 2210JD6-5]
MKNNILLLILILSISCTCFSQENKVEKHNSKSAKNCKDFLLNVYISDPDDETNLRKKPNGKIVLKLKNDNYGYTIQVTESKKEWFKVKTITSVEGDTIEIPGGTAWIHNSLTKAGTRKDIKLLDTPKNGSVVGTVKQENEVHILEICSDWVKVKYDGISGWASSEWLCGSPVTTCP